MHLSDAFEQNTVEYTNSQCQPYGLELTCTVYNINPGYNEDIQGASRVLSGYTSFVEKVRSFAKEELALRDAIERAVNECIREGILVEFFTEHHAEVVKVAALDFTFERREKLIRRDSLEEEVSLIEAICKTAEPFAPEYDERKIYDMLETKI